MYVGFVVMDLGETPHWIGTFSVSYVDLISRSSVVHHILAYRHALTIMDRARVILVHNLASVAQESTRELVRFIRQMILKAGPLHDLIGFIAKRQLAVGESCSRIPGTVLKVQTLSRLVGLASSVREVLVLGVRGLIIWQVIDGHRRHIDPIG